jgi:hypothetical protein
MLSNQSQSYSSEGQLRSHGLFYGKEHCMWYGRTGAFTLPSMLPPLSSPLAYVFLPSIL